MSSKTWTIVIASLIIVACNTKQTVDRSSGNAGKQADATEYQKYVNFYSITHYGSTTPAPLSELLNRPGAGGGGLYFVEPDGTQTVPQSTATAIPMVPTTAPPPPTATAGSTETPGAMQTPSETPDATSTPGDIATTLPMTPTSTQSNMLTPIPVESPTAQATQSPTVTKTPRRCCACVYQDRSDTLCGALSGESQCRSTAIEASDRDMFMCVWDGDRCVNSFEQGCKRIFEIGAFSQCDVKATKRTTFDAFDTQYAFPESDNCESTEVMYVGHGAPDKCSALMQSVQATIDGAGDSCTNFEFNTTGACQMFKDSDAAIASAQALCLGKGKSCTITGNQCNGVYEIATGCAVNSYKSNLTLCVKGNPKPTVTPIYINCNSIGEADEHRSGQTLKCSDDSGNLKEKSCCQFWAYYPSPGDDENTPPNPKARYPAWRWLDGSTCPALSP